MKKVRLSKKFLEELEKLPNVSIACEKCGLSRQTVYRWMEEDLGFKKRVDKALGYGIESINDLAESKLISHINNGNLRAIENWLKNHSDRYYTPKSPIPHPSSQCKPINSIEIIEVKRDNKENTT